MNFLAMSFNGWKMPVKEIKGYAKVNGKKHFGFENKSEIKLYHLSDIIIIKFKHKQKAISIGDIFLVIGMGIMIIGLII